MTQKTRWLAPLVLLLAFGAYGVRAEEEEVPPPPHSVVELLPPPTLVPAGLPCVRIMTPCPCPCPCLCPAPVVAAAYAAPCGQACPVCPAYNVHASASRQDGSDAAEYVVSAKMVKAGPDGDLEEVLCPRVSVAEGQTATIQVHGVETPREHRSLGMQFRVTTQARGAQLDLGVEDSTAYDGASGRRMTTEAMRTECNVTLGKAAKVELKHDADGTATAWIEVTVTEVEREERASRTACGSYPSGACAATKPCDKDESDESAMDCVEEVVTGVGDLIAYTASGVFGRHTWVEEMTLPSGQYLEHPPQYLQTAAPFPLTRELATREAVWTPCPTDCSAGGASMSPCPAAGCSTAATARPTCGSGCTQCDCAAAVKKPTLHIRLDAANDRKVLELCDGEKCWKASADHLMLRDDSIELEGNIHAESGDGVTSFEAHKMTWKLKTGLEILIGD